MNKIETIAKEANYWHACKKEGTLKYQEEYFKSWINENIEHKKAYEKLEKLDFVCNSLDEEDLNELTNEVFDEINKTKKFIRFKYFASAAVFIIAVFVGGLKTYKYHFQANHLNTLATNTKPISKHILPDGSVLALDAKTKMNIKFYNKKRYVELLDGQAMFDIKSDKNRPFVIKSNRTEITVLGTSFEVKNRNNQTDVKVVEGKVKVSYIKEGNKNPRILTLLTKGDQVSVNKEGKIVNLSKVDPKAIALWKENKIFFDNKKLKDAVEEFSKYVNKKIIIEDKALLHLPVTGKFFINEENKFFKAISAIYPIKVTKTANTISLSKRI